MVVFLIDEEQNPFITAVAILPVPIKPNFILINLINVKSKDYLIKHIFLVSLKFPDVSL